MKCHLTELRYETGMTQQALANLVGTSRQTIVSIEKGRYEPGLRLAIHISRVFDRAVEEVFDIDAE